MEVAVTKISSKGQIVIPSPMRKNIKVGDQFLIVKDGNKIIMKKITELAKELKEELKFAQRVEHAWKEYEKGKFKSKEAKQFLKDLEQW